MDDIMILIRPKMKKKAIPDSINVLTRGIAY